MLTINGHQTLLIDLILGRELPARGEILIDHIPVKEYFSKYSGTVGIISELLGN